MDSMKFTPIYAGQSEAMFLPQLIRLKPNLVVASFRLMKLIPARHVVMKAWHEGKIDPKLGVIETSSGTYALALAMVCAELKVPFHVISDPAIDAAFCRRLVDLGGNVTIVSKDHTAANIQVQRLQVVYDHLDRYPGTFWPRQYDNPNNRLAYKVFGKQLLASLGDFNLVCTVGTGGSSAGTIETVREERPETKLIGVDTFGSVLFGLPVGKRMLRGLGNAVWPKNVRHELFDEVHWVTAAEAFHHTRRLHRQAALFMGPTSGAAFQVADWLSEQNKDETYVFVAADEGHRYQDSIYDDNWLRQNEVFVKEPTSFPTQCETIGEIRPDWASISWGRRSFEEVNGHPMPSKLEG